MKRMLDILRPQIEAQLKAWGSCIPDGGSMTPGEHLSEVTVTLRTKLRSYLEAIMEKLVENVSSFIFVALLYVHYHIFVFISC